MGGNGTEALIAGRNISTENIASRNVSPPALSSGSAGEQSFASVLALSGDTDRARAFNEDGLFGKLGEVKGADKRSKSGKITGQGRASAGNIIDHQRENITPLQARAAPTLDLEFERVPRARTSVFAPLLSFAADSAGQGIDVVRPVFDRAFSVQAASMSKSGEIAVQGGHSQSEGVAVAKLMELRSQRSYIPLQVALQNLRSGVRLVVYAKNLTQAERHQAGKDMISLLAVHGLYNVDFEFNGTKFA